MHEDLYKQLGSSGAENHLPKSIFVIVIGSNDILGYFRSSDLQKKDHPTPVRGFSDPITERKIKGYKVLTCLEHK